MVDKKQLRKQIVDDLLQIPKSEYSERCHRVANQLYKQLSWKQASVVGITVSKYPELNTIPIIENAWEQGKTVVVPKCSPLERTMTFREITSLSQLEIVYYGLKEPIEKLTKEYEPNDIDLLIVPGIAYTKEGYRLGFGGGYYDRFLVNYNGETVSLAFQEQIVRQLPIEEHDVPVMSILIEENER